MSASPGGEAVDGFLQRLAALTLTIGPGVEEEM
jgi:hypothetical protein